jgi:hypothetical protein
MLAQPYSPSKAVAICCILLEKNAPMHIIDIMIALKQQDPDEAIDLHEIEDTIEDDKAFVAAGPPHTYALSAWQTPAGDIRTLTVSSLAVEALKEAAGPLHVSQIHTHVNQHLKTSIASLVQCIEEDSATFRSFDKGFVGLAAIDYPRSELARTTFFATGYDYVMSRLQGKALTKESLVNAMKGRLSLSDEDAILWIQLNGH